MNLLRTIAGMNQHTCPWWFGYTFDNPLRPYVHNAESILGEFVAKGDRVLDVGCGLGYFTLELAKLVGSEGRVIAIDLQSEMLERARRRAARRGLEERIDFRLSKAESIDESQSVDFVLAFWMLHEVRERDKFLSKIRTILKPSGHLLIAEPRGHVPGPLFDREVAAARAAGFDIRPAPDVRFSRAVVCVPNTPANFRTDESKA